MPSLINPDQFGGVVRTAAVSVVIWAAAKGWLPGGDKYANEITAVIVTLGTLIWSLMINRTSALVAAVDAKPDVVGVITQPTKEGIALAQAVPAPTVAPAKTEEAIKIAQDKMPKR